MSGAGRRRRGSPRTEAERLGAFHARRAAAPLAESRDVGAARCGTPVQPGLRVVCVTSEQPPRRFPLVRVPCPIDLGLQPGHPPAGVSAGLPRPQRSNGAHAGRSVNVATRSAASRLLRSSACRYIAVDCNEACPNSARTTSSDTGSHPPRRRRVPQHVRPGPHIRSTCRPVEGALRRRVLECLAKRRGVQVDEHRVVARRGTDDLIPFVLVVGVQPDQRLGHRHRPRVPRLRQRTIGVSPAPHMEMDALDHTAQRPAVGQQMHVLATQAQALTDPGARDRHHGDKQPVTHAVAGTQQSIKLGVVERLREQLEGPNTNRGRPDPSELTALARVEASRKMCDEPRLGQLVSDTSVDPAAASGEPQELADRRQMTGHRRRLPQPFLAVDAAAAWPPRGSVQASA